MDETTFRILDTLSRALGKPLSINELTRKMQDLHGTAYYANTYRKLQTLAAQGSITLTKAGRSSLVTLNFRNYYTVDMLTEVEIERKRRFLEKRPDSLLLLSNIDRHLRDLQSIKSMSLINSEKNIKLNRAELLILLRYTGEAAKINARIQTLQRMLNLKIDCLTLSTDEFLNLLKSEEKNPLQEMLADEIAFFHPQELWEEIRNALEQSTPIKTSEKMTNPLKIPAQDMSHNLARFGYREIGPKTRRGKDICIEYVITSVLMRNDARRVEAIPVMLAKNSVNYNLLIFLSQKYELSGRLLGLLKILNRIRRTEKTEAALRSLETMDVKEIKADEESIAEKMNLYNA